MSRSLDHGHEICEISSRYNLAVRSYSPDTNFDCLHCDPDLRDMTLFQDQDPIFV